VLHVGYDLDVLPLFPDGYFDWVYLDTTHRRDDAYAELLALEAKVRGGGLVAGDDWYEDPRERHHGLSVAVHDFLQRSTFTLVYATRHDNQWATRKIP
jgi:hypothetical protein